MWVRFLLSLPIHGGRGEVVNASDCGSDIRGFDSHRSPQWEHSQVVRHRSAKPLFPGSNPGAPSKKFVPVAQLDRATAF